jgi:glycosyltransferase involved in cell wall biosynthesis
VGNEGWGASSPAEIDEALEAIYQQPDEARAKGEAAAEFLQTLSWDHQVERLLEVLDEVS